MKITMLVPLMLVSLVAALAGCAGSAGVSAPAPAQPMSTVPPGCDPGKVPVQWSGITRTVVLEHVALFTMGEGREVVDAPVIAGIGGVVAPDTWLRLLATNLEREIGTGVHTIRPSSSYGMSFGSGADSDPDIPESVVFTGVRRISAAFTVECTPTVSGTLTGWTETTASGLQCGDFAPPSDPYSQAARQYCPRVPGSYPS